MSNHSIIKNIITSNIKGACRCACTLLLFSSFSPVLAQRHEILSPTITSLQVVAGKDWLLPPITQLGGEPINISFDDLTHEYHRYTYRIEHCEADWTTSEEIFTSDYCEGYYEDNPIDDLVESINTNTLYTHYSLQIPNGRCRLKIGGNYRLTVVDNNNDDTPILTVCFMVVEPLMKVGLSMTTNTDYDINKRHQQIAMDLKYGNLTVTSPETQIKTVVMQNGRWDNAVVNAKPQYLMSDGLRWDHCRDFIFNGGNEYRKFEILDPEHPTLGVETISWDGENYNAMIWTDEPRQSYIYDEDANGAFYIRNSDNFENDYSSDYILTHFRLKSPRLEGKVYLNASWTYDRFEPKYEMQYDDLAQLYTTTLPLKQGYYSYQYLWLRNDGTTAPVPSEGNFYQTENQYQALVYYRPIGGRTDILVGFGQIRK